MRSERTTPEPSELGPPVLSTRMIHIQARMPWAGPRVPMGMAENSDTQDVTLEDSVKLVWYVWPDGRRTSRMATETPKGGPAAGG